MRSYLFQLLLWLSQGLSVLLGGWADEAFSARAWRQRHKRRWALAVRVVDTLFFWERDHCHTAYLSEQRRIQLPPQYRTPKAAQD